MQKPKKNGSIWYPLFHKLEGDALSAATLRCLIKEETGKIGLDPKEYGGYSTRSGGATTMIKNGVELRVLQKHGRWKSDAVFVYLRDNAVDLFNAQMVGFGAAERLALTNEERKKNFLPKEASSSMIGICEDIKKRKFISSFKKPSWEDL